MKILLITLMLAFTQAAFATGETSCQTIKPNFEMNTYTLNGHVPGNPVLDASVEVKVDNTIYQLKKENMVGWWAYNQEIKMYFVKLADGNDTADTELIVETKYSYDLGEFVGTVTFKDAQGNKYLETTHCLLN